MKLTFTPSASLALLVFGLGLTSCIQEEYDFRNVDMEMTTCPGISIPMETSLDAVGTSDLLDMGSCITGESGTYESLGETAVATAEVSGDELANGTVNSDIKIEIPVSVPEFIKSCNSEFRFHDPELSFKISNPVDYTVVMNATAKGSGKSFDFSLEMAAGAKDQTITIKGAQLAEILCPVPDAVMIENVSFTGKPLTKATTELDATKVVYEILANANIKMEFEPGSVIAFDSRLDLIEMGADMSKLAVSSDDFTLSTSITSTFPFDLSAKAASEDNSTTLEIDGIIKANATSDVTLNAKTDGKIADIKVITVSVTAVNNGTEPAAFSDGCTLNIDIDRLTATSGITYNPQQK